MWVFDSKYWKCASASLAMIAFTTFSPSPSAASSWFWDEVPSQIDAGSRAKAMQVVANARNQRERIFGTKAQARRVLVRWRPEIQAAARKAGINEALIVAIVIVESGGNPNAISPKGARGLGQLMPGTALRYGVQDALNPAENLRGAATYLSDLIIMFRGDLVLALAAYNSGENAVLKYRGVPPYAETRGYVPRVLAAFETAGDFCAFHPRAARRKCQLSWDLR
jgi:soluble lytic murein transglycosylase-like protein